MTQERYFVNGGTKSTSTSNLLSESTPASKYLAHINPLVPGVY